MKGIKSPKGSTMSPENQPLNYVGAPFDFSLAECDDAPKKGKGKKGGRPFGMKGAS